MHYFMNAPNKYYNKKCFYGDMQFDSKKELNRFLELDLLQRAGEISNLQRQVEFVLIPNQYETIEKTLKSGKIKQEQKLIERKCSYIADFVYTDKQGNTIVEDTKGIKTAEYIIKRKLMLYLQHIKVVEL